MIVRVPVRTSDRCQFVNITPKVQGAVSESGVEAGIAVVFVPHTTAGVTINENADPSVCSDMLRGLAELAPHSQPFYRHMEGNSDAHIKASLIGSSVTVLVEDGRLVLGTWQGIYFAEFDGPRSREVFIKVQPDAS